MELIFQEKRKIILALLLSLSIFLILFRFTDTPKVWVDEGVFTEVAKNLAWHGTLGLQTSPGNFFPMNGFNLSTSYPVIFPVAMSFKLFGSGLWQARLPMALYMFSLVFVFYLFTKKRYGFKASVLSVLTLLSFAPFYGNGRPVQGEVPGMFFLVLGSYLLLRLEESFFQDKRCAILSGLAFGLCASTKPTYLVVASMALIVTLLFWFREIKNKKILLFFGSGFIIPIIIWFFIHFPTLDLILNIIPSYLYFAGNHGSSLSTTQTVINNFLRFFKESTPVLFLVLLLISVSSFSFLRLKNKNHRFSISEYVIFFFIILNALAYLPGTGWYRYFFPAHILLYTLFSGAMISLVRVIEKPILRKTLLAIPFILILFQFYYLVFLSDTSFIVKRTRNTELASVLNNIDSSKRILFRNAPETIIFLKGDNYSQSFYMDTFLIVGDEKALEKPDYDYILTDVSQRGNVALSCYREEPLSQYYLLQKRDDCKK